MANKTIHKTVKIKAKKDDSDSRLYALLGIALMIVGYVIVMLTRKEDKYAMYYAKQGLVLFIACVIFWVAGQIVGWIPFIGSIIALTLNLITVVLWIIGIIYALSGEEREIPIIGSFARKI